jgi:hypothetical protein
MDLVLELADSPTWLSAWDAFKVLDWIGIRRNLEEASLFV